MGTDGDAPVGTGANTHRAPSLRRTSVAVSIVLALDTLASITTAILLARVLGAAGLGLYAIGIAVGRLPTPLLQFGFPVLATREINRGRATGDLPLVRGVMTYAWIVVIGICVLYAGLAWALSPLVVQALPESMHTVAAMGVFLTPLVALTNLGAGCLQGWQRISTAAIGSSLGQSGLLILFLALTIWLAPGWLTPERAVQASVLVTIINLAIMLVILARLAVPKLSAARAIYRAKEWTASAARLAAAGGLLIFEQHALVLILGVLAGETQGRVLPNCSTRRLGRQSRPQHRCAHNRPQPQRRPCHR